MALAAVLLAAGGPSPAAANKHCNADDKAALLVIKAAFGNPYHFASWIPSAPCCEWYDVHCDPATNRVDELAVFQDANITGVIPAAVAGLPFLKTLTFHHLPGVSGPIPRALAKLKNLQFLTISFTGVSGTVPAFLGELTALSQLDLSFNSLSGAIPPELGSLPSLISIDISRNRLTGALPPSLFSKLPRGQSSSPAYLRLSHNALSGGIPPAFAAVSFAQVDLSRNDLAGDASVLFGAAKALNTLDLSRNQFSFNLSGVAFPTGADFIDLSHNEIAGGIPAEVAALPQLQGFNVSYNRLCGPIPVGGNLDRFDRFSYEHNKCLCGPPLQACQ